MNFGMYHEALSDYEAALVRSPMNETYAHAQGKCYEAFASIILKTHGKRKRFDLQPDLLREDNESMLSYLRQDYVEQIDNAIKMHLQAIEINENFQPARIHAAKNLSKIYQY